MVRKLIIDADPGIGDALAIVVSLLDPTLEVVALTATEGAVSGAVASRNLQAILGEIDPPRWPRIGTAGIEGASDSDVHPLSGDLRFLSGRSGLGDCEFQTADFHHRKESARLLHDLVRTEPHELTLLTLGPLHNLLAANDRDPEFFELLQRIVCLGGSVSDGGDLTPAAEMNMYLNPEAARLMLRSQVDKTLIPLDATNRVVLSFENFNRLSEIDSRAAAFLRQLLPYYFRAHHQYLGVEGVFLREVTAVAYIARPELFRTQTMSVDVETKGELTRGMTVFDRRTNGSKDSNAAVVTDVEPQVVLDYLNDILSRKSG